MRTPAPALAAAALACLAVAAGCRPEATATIERTDAEERPEERRIVQTDRAPAAIGPYSQGVLVGNTLYLAGQIPLDPETGEMVEGGIGPETRQVMENLGAVLHAAGFDFGDVVQSQVFLADLDDFSAMNEVYGEYFGEASPARATVEVARLPRDARVEILFTAVRSP